MGPRRVSIKVKLAGALAVPLIALSVVSGLEVVRSLDRAEQVRRQTDLATAAIGPSGLITALQNERNFTGLWLLGATDIVDLPVSDMTEARNATDAAREAFAAEIEDKGDEVARIYGPGLAALDQIDQLRASVDAYDGPQIVTEFNQVAEDSFLGYSDLVSTLSDRNSEVITEVEDPELRRGVQLIDLSSREVDSIAHQTRLMLLAAVTGDRLLADPAEISRRVDDQRPGAEPPLQDPRPGSGAVRGRGARPGGRDRGDRPHRAGPADDPVGHRRHPGDAGRHLAGAGRELLRLHP